MYQNLLPLGSVVEAAGIERRLMICGRVVCREGSEKIYDYAGVVYPEGLAGESQLFFFDTEAIERLLFLGFQDAQEEAYQNEVLGQLGELAVEDGEIFPVEEEPDV